MKNFLLILLTFGTLLSCKSQSADEKIKQDIKQIFNYIKTDNITELKKHLITKSIFKDYLREQIRLTSQEDYKLKMKEAYEKQLNKKISKEELNDYINKTRKQFKEMLNNNEQLNQYFKSMAIQDDYNIEYLNMIKKKGRKSINWNRTKLYYFLLNSGSIIFSDDTQNRCFIINTNIIQLDNTFYYSFGDVGSVSNTCNEMLYKNKIKKNEFIDYTK